MQEGGQLVNPQELTQVSDWGEQTQPTHLQPEGCRVWAITSCHPYHPYHPCRQQRLNQEHRFSAGRSPCTR
ncbi:hypothetical protein D8U42_08815 [Salmonella enterica]|nr:hypothetical protein [Salmonella enterica]